MFVLSTMFFAVYISNVNAFAENREAEKYERDYLSRVFDSENGLEGTTANCICADSKGFLWFGGYTGLYRYDGSEFKKYLLDGRALPVNAIVEDNAGNLWIGTNGEGVYCFDGSDFSEYTLNDRECGASVINQLYLDSEGVVWAGTKAGLFSINTKADTKSAKEYKRFSDSIIKDISENSKDEKIILQKTGEVYFLKDGDATEVPLRLSEKDGTPRCCSTGKNGIFYIGTTGNRILKVADNGSILARIETDGLSSFNKIYELNGREYWVCSDTGIGILKNDELTKMEFPFDDSIEGGCQDYQGNYWFVSSRQGIMQIYENHFSNLETYWGLKQTVNSIQVYHGKTYVGCDDGLYCFEGKEKVEDALTEACQGMRIRQIYLDGDDDLWISTYQNGIKVLRASGKISSYSTVNSGIGTNQIRCIWQMQNKDVLIGTEEGLYVRDYRGVIKNYTGNNILNTKRILDVREDSTGTVYASTDGYGVFELENGVVKNVYSKQQGLLSNVVMKVVPSDRMDGTWIVTGEGICFISRNGNIRQVTGLPVANSLDLLIEDDKAIILAGNGFFEAKEKDLLEESLTYTYYSKQDGLPVDFTANAGNTIEDGNLYMCGTTGATSIDLDETEAEKPIRLYVNEITEDGEPIKASESGNIISPNAHRINIDVRMINFVHRNIFAGYCLGGMDEKETIITDLDSDISYTNLDGGSYTYKYTVYDSETGKALSGLTINFAKKYTFWEEPRVKVLLIFLGIGMLILLFILLVSLREKGVKRKYYLEFLQEKEAEISDLAYKDLVTGVYNRNYFEHEKDKIDLKKMRALLSVSVNHAEYFKGKYGVFFMESILRKGVKILQDCTSEKIKICRVSENIFYFWFMEPVQMETYISDIKTAFKELGDKEKIPYSFSVGAIYNNTVGKENIDELIDRCGKMRLLDEKHSEAQFIEGKMKML